jgi:hypothetical protein
MVNLEALTTRGMRAYQLGRLRMASRVALVLVPIIALCLLESYGRETCACLSVLLVAVAVGLRFRNRSGVDSVTTGLLAGAVPLAASLVFSRFDPGCATAGVLSVCTAFSILLGGLAGAIVAYREATQGKRSGHGLTALVITALVASLGCARLGMASVVGVVVGIVLGRATTLLTRRAA